MVTTFKVAIGSHLSNESFSVENPFAVVIIALYFNADIYSVLQVSFWRKKRLNFGSQLFVIFFF